MVLSKSDPRWVKCFLYGFKAIFMLAIAGGTFIPSYAAILIYYAIAPENGAMMWTTIALLFGGFAMVQLIFFALGFTLFVSAATTRI